MYEFFQSLFQHLINAFHSFFTWLGNVFHNFFEAIKNLFAALFKPVINFFQGIFYLLGKCFYIAVLVIQVIFGIFKVIGAVITGAIHTFSQLLSFGGSTSYYHMPGAYQQGWSTVVSFVNSTGMSTIAVIMTVFVWLMTAYAVIKIAGGEK